MVLGLRAEVRLVSSCLGLLQLAINADELILASVDLLSTCLHFCCCCCMLFAFWESAHISKDIPTCLPTSSKWSWNLLLGEQYVSQQHLQLHSFEIPSLNIVIICTLYVPLWKTRIDTASWFPSSYLRLTVGAAWPHGQRYSYNLQLADMVEMHRGAP